MGSKLPMSQEFIYFYLPGLKLLPGAKTSVFHFIQIFPCFLFPFFFNHKDENGKVGWNTVKKSNQLGQSTNLWFKSLVAWHQKSWCQSIKRKSHFRLVSLFSLSFKTLSNGQTIVHTYMGQLFNHIVITCLFFLSENHHAEIPLFPEIQN